ncbi:MAG: hypothetical protein JWQ65_375 [Devosia sp.]|nr:hypothetical protein [Devosia sp.]
MTESRLFPKTGQGAFPAGQWTGDCRTPMM